MSSIEKYISGFSNYFSNSKNLFPWEITTSIFDHVEKQISVLDENYLVNGNIAIHKSAVIEVGAILKGPIIISGKCFIGANAYLRGGIFLDDNVSIGPGCEIKSSIVFSNSSLAHFNFIGDSIVGSNVNFEAGAVIANHFNERESKMISVLYSGNKVETNLEKFGALVGDNSKIGANAVLSPGTILDRNSIVKRLELVEQIKSK